MLEPIVPVVRTTFNAAVIGTQAYQVAAHSPQLSVAVAEAPANAHAFYSAEETMLVEPVPRDYELQSSIAGPGLLEEIEEVDEFEEVEPEDVSYPELEMPVDREEQSFVFMEEPSPLPAQFEESGFEPEIEQYDTPDTIEQAGASTEYAPAASAPINQSTINDYKMATDPWNDPLPAWEFSQHEWPVMLTPKKPSGTRKLWVPLVLFLVVAGAVIYFLVLQPRTDTKGKKSGGDQKPLVVASPAATEKANASTDRAVAPSKAATDSATDSASEPKPQEPQDAATVAGSAQGQFTLQIASMPNEKAANEMAEKMKAAGLPAYVQSAEIGSRGRWFRVRVGSFATAEEAKSFAARSRLEARVERIEN